VRAKLFSIAAIGVAALVIVGVVMGIALQKVAAATTTFESVGEAVRAELEADMSHDAIRAHVTQGLLFSTGDLHTEAIAGVTEDGANMLDKLDFVAKTVDDAEIQSQVAAASELVKTYVAKAAVTVKASEGSATPAQIDALYQDFMTDFNAVLDALPKVADRLTALSAQEADTLRESESMAQTALIAVLLLGIVGILLAAMLVSGDITRRLSTIQESVAALGRGQLNREVPALGKDQIGQMAADLEVTRVNIRDVVSGVARGVESLQSASMTLSTASAQGASASRETSVQAQAVSGSTAHVTSAMEGLSAAAEEMSASITEIASSAAEASRVAQDAVSVVKQTSSDVEKLGRASAEIDEVVKVINGIADQTNLLALNATIEAARAGEAGKGFAVVAGEVKDLAAETAKATSDVSSRVAAIQAGAQSAVQAIEQISSIIERINDYQTAVAAAVEEQTATTNEMSRGIGGIVASASEIAAGVDQVTAAAAVGTEGAMATEESAGQVVATAGELRALSASFSL
jgi:methyl-accepting chemotaxis protein